MARTSTRARSRKVTPTIESANSDQFNGSVTQPTPDEADKLELVAALEGYRNEADNARKGGLNPRDAKWQENLDLYWGRNDFSKKANWQAKENMPEVPSYVDRFAAALKEALVSVPGGFYTVTDPADAEGDLAQSVKKMLDVWLTRTGRNQMGQLLPFSATFEEQVKMGATTACCAVTTWKEDVKYGRVAIETVDPRFVWLDHTYRNLYRIRRIEVDRYDLKSMLKQMDGAGKPIFDLEQMGNLINSVAVDDQARREEMSGHGQNVSTGRQPVVLDEYIATVLNSQGDVIADRALIVVANGRFIIRGPEANPFWHGQDWLVFAPMVTAPLSVYGRSYMEDFGSVAKTFITLTNLILDAVHTTSLKSIAMVPGMLMNPEQVAEGLTPNKLWLLEDGYRAEDFAHSIDLGQLPTESIKVWEAIKNELAEAANINEIGLGQFAPKGRTSATEISETKQSSSALIRSVAQTIETRFLDPVLDLSWKTGLQHMHKDDPSLSAAAGEDMYNALWSKRKELIERPFTFQARGISSLISRSSTLKNIVGLLQMLASNPVLLQQFMQTVSVPKLVGKLFELSNVDIKQFQPTQREQMIQQMTQPLQQAQGAAGGEQGPGGPAGQVAQQLGVASG